MKIYDGLLTKVKDVSSAVEAVVHVSRDGLPLAWNSQQEESVDEIASIAAAMFRSTVSQGIFPSDSPKRLTLRAAHGALCLYEFDDQTLLVVALVNRDGQAQVENRIDRLLLNQKTQGW